MNFDDRILLKLKRQYSIDETVALLSERLKASEIENGILKSEIAELEHNNKKQVKEISNLNKIIEKLKLDLIGYKNDDGNSTKVIALKEHLKRTMAQRTEFRNQARDFRDKWIALSIKQNK